MRPHAHGPEAHLEIGQHFPLDQRQVAGAQVEERGLERTICDYIAGMTDRFAIDEYQKLFEPAALP